MIKVSDPDPYWIRIQSGQWIRIRIRNLYPDPGEKNDPQKYIKKIKKFYVLKCWMFTFESFFCNFRPRDRKIVIFDLKNVFFFSCKLFSIFGHQNPGSGLDVDPDRS